MSIKERIRSYIKSQSLTISDFEKSIFVSNGYVNSISKGIGRDKIELIVEKYPNLNIEWLLTGKGDMLKSDSPAPPIHNIYVEPSPESPVSPKSPEPVSVNFAFMLERYEHLARENERLEEKNRKLEEENADLKQKISRTAFYDHHNQPDPLMAAEPEGEYK